MGRRWLVGLVAAIAVVCMAGVGFSAFTAQAAVNGTANTATMGLQITESSTYGCFYYYNVPGAPGSVVITGENAALTSLSFEVSNMTPSTYCFIVFDLVNTGSVAVNVSAQLETAGANGMCVADQISCYGVVTQSGIASDGSIYVIGAPNFGTPTYSSSNFVTLSPGAAFGEAVGVDLPPGSDNSTPASASFTIVYTATPGLPGGTPEGAFSGVAGA
jgi:hypothetical protein